MIVIVLASIVTLNPVLPYFANSLYVLAGARTTVERALINDDSSLAPFATVPDITLMAGFMYSRRLVVGNYLYLIEDTFGEPSRILGALLDTGSQ